MTVAVVVKVHDGIVLAADSALTYPETGQVYNNADKIFHLHRQLPLAAMTFGVGQIDDMSVGGLIKDFRLRLMGKDPAYGEWELEPTTYDVEGASRRVVGALHELMARSEMDFAENPLGIVFAGFSATQAKGEAWGAIVTGNGDEPELSPVAGPSTVGWLAFAQQDATQRLFRGYDDRLYREILEAVPEESREAVEKIFAQQVVWPLASAMPFADAIQLAKFLVEVTSGYAHFIPGPDTVGGDIDVAGISRHEGFKWVSRKHYYDLRLNPGEVTR
ncbi:hypothetical protein [Mycobacteroides abscessus]|uniref:hypothetical protein n=1 Tax=Mycobacteroides abscessus TaxID=36809 RepID=UPI000668DB27|nr:hypothetical protein [Mycobacteroides abscessus]AKP56671.1 hypothetical protein MAUC22_02480 [Mycobacteroides abscessus UC22]MCU8694047.1 hypothetical protein [Mycobacteroides abscessus]MCU8713255.1 hypothetical protein [Mycobacteroides abscessus]MCU8718000.1 hypothetical protein [Mycobacteroides abscessus]MCU8752192.1 hypothetical protein [Mycobacteroides abscessus]